jgi:hypothetical protein|tara:strand:+ start:57 stop:320 length:264 start_codon:yes stop_codon:yes gene_type:complete
MKIADFSNIEVSFKEVNNPDNYSVPHDIMCLVWIALDEAGNTELSRLVANTMQAQGCDELDNADLNQVLSFWSEYLEDKIKLTQETH